jgi:hypothetical protein
MCEDISSGDLAQFGIIVTTVHIVLKNLDIFVREQLFNI